MSSTRSPVHKLLLAFTFAVVASGAIVFTEPAPIDVLMIGLIILLPAAGLTRTPALLMIFACLLIFIACGSVLATMGSPVLFQSATHNSISLYLYLTSFIFAAFIAKNPQPHTRLIMSAYVWAAILAALAGLIGYFDLIPGTRDLFTKFSRASGTFKDPNVFGPFLIPALLYALHQATSRHILGTIISLLVAGLLALAILLSFSRGAWFALAFSSLLWGYLSFVTAASNRRRLKLIIMALGFLALAAAGFISALQSDKISGLFRERASLQQSYDYGPDGRFGGHLKATGQILEHPLGIGAMTFARTIHREDVHNVYLSTFLNAGWPGGFAYLILIILTFACGLRHAFRRVPTQGLFIVVFSAFCSMLLQGLVIDTDHWRHFYLIVGVIWGLMSIERSGRSGGHLLPAVFSPVAGRYISQRKKTLLDPLRPRGRLLRRRGRILRKAGKTMKWKYPARRRQSAVSYRTARHSIAHRRWRYLHGLYRQ